MIVVHGARAASSTRGAADWEAIAEVVRAVDVPVLANGDIVDGATARAALAASGAAGVMVGRGAQGAPWRLAEIAAALWRRPTPVVPEGAALADLVAAHFDASLSFYGRDLGARVIRKHLGWYLGGGGRRGRVAPGGPDRAA